MILRAVIFIWIQSGLWNFQKPPSGHACTARRHKLQTQFLGFSSWTAGQQRMNRQATRARFQDFRYFEYFVIIMILLWWSHTGMQILMTLFGCVVMVMLNASILYELMVRVYVGDWMEFSLIDNYDEYYCLRDELLNSWMKKGEFRIILVLGVSKHQTDEFMDIWYIWIMFKWMQLIFVWWV